MGCPGALITQTPPSGTTTLGYVQIHRVSTNDARARRQASDMAIHISPSSSSEPPPTVRQV